jgi:hypothetical protein
MQSRLILGTIVLIGLRQAQGIHLLSRKLVEVSFYFFELSKLVNSSVAVKGDSEERVHLKSSALKFFCARFFAQNSRFGSRKMACLSELTIFLLYFVEGD